MPRYAFKLAYDGTDFAGFQWQDDAPSVQGVVEKAIRKLEPNFDRIVASGRTDAGVHALGQVVHADLSQDWKPYRLQEALNFHMKPNPVSILDSARVDDEFSARFSCIQRRYIFRIIARKSPLTITRRHAWQLRHELDIDAMHEAAQVFLGEHDFTTFRSSSCQAKSPIKTVDKISVSAQSGFEEQEIHIEVEARSFMHNQVRSFVGTLERVGAGKWTKSDVEAALQACDRAACGPVSPPHGLFFMEAKYPFAVFKSDEF